MNNFIFIPNAPPHAKAHWTVNKTRSQHNFCLNIILIKEVRGLNSRPLSHRSFDTTSKTIFQLKDWVLNTKNFFCKCLYFYFFPLKWSFLYAEHLCLHGKKAIWNSIGHFCQRKPCLQEWQACSCSLWCPNPC